MAITATGANPVERVRKDWRNMRYGFKLAHIQRLQANDHCLRIIGIWLGADDPSITAEERKRLWR